MISAPAEKGRGCDTTPEPQTLVTPPPPQVPVVQVPQLSVPPHPSEIEPQFLPAEAQLSGVQATHWLFTQLEPAAAQVPQSIASPQPLNAVPHW